VLWKEPRLRITEAFFRELNYTADDDTLHPVNLELVSEQEGEGPLSPLIGRRKESAIRVNAPFLSLPLL